MFCQDSLKSRCYPKGNESKFKELMHSIATNSKEMGFISTILRNNGFTGESKTLEKCIHSYLSMQALLATQFSKDPERKYNERNEEVAYKDEIIQSLRSQNQELQDRNNQLSQSLDELTTRISQIMSSQEKDRTDAHESLMDKCRPSVIVVKFRALYTQYYGEISAELQDVGYTDDNIAEVLLSILMKCTDLTKKYVERAKSKTISKVQKIFEESPFAQQEKRSTLSKHLLDEVCKILREAPDRNIIINIQKAIICQYYPTETVGPDFKMHFENYVNECVEVTWLMNACNPAMYLHYDEGDNINYSPNRHTKFSGNGEKIDYFLWPCVYFSEDAFLKSGNVMAKSVVALKKSSKAKPPTSKLPGTDYKASTNQLKDFNGRYGQGWLGSSKINDNQNGDKGVLAKHYDRGTSFGNEGDNQKAEYNISVAATETSNYQPGRLPPISKQPTIWIGQCARNPMYPYNNATQGYPESPALASSYKFIENNPEEMSMNQHQLFHHSEGGSGWKAEPTCTGMEMRYRMGESKTTACPVHHPPTGFLRQSKRPITCTCNY